MYVQFIFYLSLHLNHYTHNQKINTIQTKSNTVLKTWYRPNNNDQFTSPIVYSNDNKWLISSVYNKVDKTSRIVLFHVNDLTIKKDDKHLIPIDRLNKNKNEFIIRIFHSHICHHWFIIITNIGNIILFNPNTKIFDYPSKDNENKNKNGNENNKLINVKLHDSISSSGYHKKITHISFIYNDNKMEIIPISFDSKSNVLSVHDTIYLSIPKNTFFYTFDDDENDQDIDIDIDNKEENKCKEEDKSIVFDYDWCLDTNHLLLLMNNGSIQCIEYVHGKNTNLWKYNVKYKIDISQHLDISIMNNNENNKLLLKQLNNDNILYSLSNTSLLSFIRIKFIEPSQFIIIGPSNQDYNTLKLWTFQSQYGFLRDNMTLSAQNINSNLLMIAPIISNNHKHHNKDDNSNNHKQQYLSSSLINCYIITSKQVIFIRLPSLGKSLLDLVEISIKNETNKEIMDIDNDNDDNKNNDDNLIVFSLNNKQRIERFTSNSDWNDAKILLNELKQHNTKIEENLFNLMSDKLIENEKWNLLKGYFLLINDYNETNLLYLLSLMINHLTYFMENKSFLSCLNTILSAKINDIFMKRCIQILPQKQVEIFIKYLCFSLNANNNKNDKDLKIVTIITWLNIILDSHLGTLAFADNDNNNTNLKECISKLRHFLKSYDEKIKSMMEIEANIHSILNEMKVEHGDSKNKNNPRNRNRSKSIHGIGGGAFGFDSNNKRQTNNDPNLYKDYVIEYIKL